MDKVVQPSVLSPNTDLIAEVNTVCHLKTNLKALTLLIFSINNVTIKKWSAKCSELSRMLTKELAYCPQTCIYKKYRQKATYTSNKDTEHETDTFLTQKKYVYYILYSYRALWNRKDVQQADSKARYNV